MTTTEVLLKIFAWVLAISFAIVLIEELLNKNNHEN